MKKIIFTAGAAQWLTQVVRPAWLAKQGDRGVCPCDYGMCGWCGQQDRHDKCPTFGSRRRRPPSPETRVISRRGFVAVGIGGDPKVWVKGKPCVWVCACEVCRAGAAVAAESPLVAVAESPVDRIPVQPALFDLIGAS